MSENVTNIDGQNKAAELSNPGKLLRAYMQATGISCAKTLADSLGIKLRTIQRLKLEIATCANDAKCAISGAANSANDAINGASQQTDEKKVSPRTPLQRNNHLEQSVQQAAARDDGRTDDVAECKAAFNGSTEAMLAMVESAMGGHCRANAAQWLANLTRINGQQAVAQAFQKFLTAKAENQIIARPLPWFDKTARTCKSEAPKPAAVADYPLAAITVDMKRNMKPAPGSARMPEAARA
jgi:hypothetical protein